MQDQICPFGAGFIIHEVADLYRHAKLN